MISDSYSKDVESTVDQTIVVTHDSGMQLRVPVDTIADFIDEDIWTMARALADEALEIWYLEFERGTTCEGEGYPTNYNAPENLYRPRSIERKRTKIHSHDDS